MKKHKTGFILASVMLVFITTCPSKDSKSQTKAGLTDTLPDLCTAISRQDVERIQPFTNLLTNVFPDPNNLDNYKACHYQFYTKNDYPQLAIRLIKWSSKKESADDFRMQLRGEFDAMGFLPERLPGIADSAYFSFDGEDSTKCNECGLVAVRGPYGIYISFKGQYETVTRAGKKNAAIRLLQLMYDRVPGLAASRIRNMQ